MKRIVLDTNVFISGIFWSGPPAKILNAWQEKNISIVLSAEILNEYIRVGEILSAKYPEINLSTFINTLSINAEIYSPIKLNEQICRDPDDDIFIKTALAAKCNIIVSGDKDLLDIDGVFNLEILKPSVFLKKYICD